MSELGQILIKKLTPDELGFLCEAYDDGSIEDIFYGYLYPEDQKNSPEKYSNDKTIVAKTKITGKFYKHDVNLSQHEHAVQISKALNQSSIPVLAENQILHLIDIAERGLPDCYNSFDEFLSNFWPNFSWNNESLSEIEAVLADPRFKKIVPVLKETWGVDMEKELQDGLRGLELQA